MIHIILLNDSIYLMHTIYLIITFAKIFKGILSKEETQQ